MFKHKFENRPHGPQNYTSVNTVEDWRLVSLDTYIYIYIYVCVFTPATCTMHTLILFFTTLWTKAALPAPPAAAQPHCLTSAIGQRPPRSAS